MRIRKLSLRVLLCSVLAFCFAFAIGANWYRSGLKQAQSVAALIQLSKETEKLGLDERVIILVYYDSDLDSVKQVWISDMSHVDLSDSLIYENTRKLVSELFPEVIAEWLLPDGIIL